MSNVHKKGSVNKVNKRKKNKQTTEKSMEQIKCTTQRSKTTQNWHQYLLQNNKNITVNNSTNNNKTTYNNKHRNQLVTKLGTKPTNTILKNATNTSVTKKFSSAVAIDCEMVGIGDGRDNMLARVSIVDENGQCLYDTFVKPMEKVKIKSLILGTIKNKI